MATTIEVAGWMRVQVVAHGRLERRAAALCIRHAFGERHIHGSQRGAGAIRAAVLDAFRALTPEAVVWSRREQAWRYRRRADPPGRRGVD